MMSGPAPVFAATAALGRTSSHPSLSTRTSMPYFSVNFCTFFMYWSMSPWTKRLQRSTRSFAPFSGVLLHCALASLIQMKGPTAALAATAADDCRNFRRLNVLMLRSSDDGPSIVPSCPLNLSGSEPLSARRVEHMRPRGIGREMDAVARTAVRAIADGRRHVAAVEAAIELRVGAGRLDDDDFHRKAGRAERAVLRAYAIEHFAPLGA